MDRLEVSAFMNVRAGALEGFKRQVAECISQTKAKDTGGTLRSDWFLSSDGTACEVREAYADSDAFLEHSAHIMEARAGLFQNFAENHRAEVYGEPSAKLLAAVEAHMAGQVTWHSFLQGLETQPDASHRAAPGSVIPFEIGAHMTVRPGQLEGFKAQAGELMRITREQDTHTLRYDWFLSKDGTQCAVREAYTSEAGLIEHNEHIMEARTVLFRDFADNHLMSVYSDASQRLHELMKVHAGGGRWFTFLQGLDPSPAVLLTPAAAAEATPAKS
jgi:quinol monooxygenase YgiN